MEIKEKSNFFSLRFEKNFFKKVFLIAISFLFGSLISFSWLQFLNFGDFYFSKVILFLLVYFLFFVLVIEAILFKKKLSLAALSIVDTASLFWLYFLEKTYYLGLKNLLSFNRIFLIELSSIIAVFFLFFLGKISIRRREKLLVNFSFSKISSFGLFCFCLSLVISFALIFNFYILFGKFLWIDGLFNFLKIDLKSLNTFDELVSRFFQDSLMAKSLENYLNEKFSFNINFNQPISQIIFKIFKEKEPFKLFLFFESTILLILLLLFSIVRFLVKIFGGIMMEFLFVSGLIKKTYKNVPKEIIEF